MQRENGSFYFRGLNFYSNARLDAMLDTFTSGKCNSDDLEKAALHAEHKIGAIVGEESEKRFVNFCDKYVYTASTRDSTKEEDQEKGIDCWVNFDSILNLPELPVQIKSSDKRVENFLKTKQYDKLGGKIIVINCGPGIDQKIFNSRLTTEIKRIKKLLSEENH
jgi:hypothetical protein